ncbi:Zinc finger protein ZPR1 [Phlyctema vagabunda]|uniref:Zinc finger protein ZPR1 n=1 Tax=Phlyctema vagabunda TaxID=108571 RepID=A0ABR4PDX3_9HELO
MAQPEDKSQVDGGAAFDDFFDSIGKKAELTNGPAHQEGGVEGETKIQEDDQRVVDEIESLCMNCHENGITRLLLTRIPYFREIILMSFFCPHCSFKNAEIQSAGEIQQRGSRYELRLTTPADFARQVVKSDTCVVKFIELDIEVPPGRGQLSNIEGLLSMILEDLAAAQDVRKQEQPAVWARIEEILAQGKKMIAGEVFPFRVALDDPAGNSWIEPDQKDGVGKLARVEYARTPEQNEALGLSGGNEEQTAEGGEKKVQGDKEEEEGDIIPNEVYSFPATCPGCTRPCTTHMKMVEIPHFKQVVIMSTVCEDCGYRSNEVKTGGEVPLLGKQITLHVDTSIDLARDILKSESCFLESPELSLAVNPGTLGGRFTTVEGLLTQVRDDLRGQIFQGAGDDGGDGLETATKTRWTEFFDKLDTAIRGDIKFTLVLKDPLASSYVQNLCAPDADPQIDEEDYERTAEEEEDLGLSDMKTEGYVDEVGDEKKRVADAADAAALEAGKDTTATDEKGQ